MTKQTNQTKTLPPVQEIRIGLVAYRVLGHTNALFPDQDKNIGLWTTTAWPSQIRELNSNSRSPSTPHYGFDLTKCLPLPEYKAPWLEWFRGANLHLTQLPERLIVVGTIDIEPIPVTATEAATDRPATDSLPIMNLDLFSLPFQFFQGDKPNSASDSVKTKDKPPKETRKSF